MTLLYTRIADEKGILKNNLAIFNVGRIRARDYMEASSVLEDIMRRLMTIDAQLIMIHTVSAV
jgi:hypothetical protein